MSEFASRRSIKSAAHEVGGAQPAGDTDSLRKPGGEVRMHAQGGGERQRERMEQERDKRRTGGERGGKWKDKVWERARVGRKMEEGGI